MKDLSAIGLHAGLSMGSLRCWFKRNVVPVSCLFVCVTKLQCDWTENAYAETPEVALFCSLRSESAFFNVDRILGSVRSALCPHFGPHWGMRGWCVSRGRGLSGLLSSRKMYANVKRTECKTNSVLVLAALEYTSALTAMFVSTYRDVLHSAFVFCPLNCYRLPISLSWPQLWDLIVVCLCCPLVFIWTAAAKPISPGGQ